MHAAEAVSSPLSIVSSHSLALSTHALVEVPERRARSNLSRRALPSLPSRSKAVRCFRARPTGSFRFADPTLCVIRVAPRCGELSSPLPGSRRQARVTRGTGLARTVTSSVTSPQMIHCDVPRLS